MLKGEVQSHEDVELLFEEENNATATFLTGTDVIAARVPPARPVRAVG